MADESKEVQYVVRNRKARHDFEIVSTIEAGIELRGCEVKSIRSGQVNLADSYAIVDNGQIFLKNLHISPYPPATGEALAELILDGAPSRPPGQNRTGRGDGT
jgi:tmRNA-binding protein